MIKNIIFDIGNVILNFNLNEVLPKFISDESDQNFILENVINSPEWLGNSLIDTGYITREAAMELVKDRTNNIKDDVIEKFWLTYNDYANIDTRLLEIIKCLKANNYNIYLLSNINPYTHEYVKKSGLFELVDGYILSYEVHKIKPYVGIYKELLNKYNLNPEECLFVDDRKENVETANKLGIKGHNVIPDNYESVVSLLNEYEIRY